MTSKISMFAASISSSLLGKTQSYSLTNKTSNVYKSASIANTVLDYSKFGTTWIENKNVPSGYLWSSISISSTQPAENKNIKYGQFQTVTYDNNKPNTVAILYSHSIGKTWNQVKITDLDLLQNKLEPLYKWTNLKMSDDGTVQLVVANNKYVFKSTDYGIKWVLDQNLYTTLKEKLNNNLKDNFITSIAMSSTGNIIYISTLNQPLYVWRSIADVQNKTIKILERTEIDANNAYNAMGLYLGYLDNTTSRYVITNTNIDINILYYYFNLITDTANIAYTANNSSTQYRAITVIMTNTILLMKQNNITSVYTPNKNNQFSIASGWTHDSTNYNNLSVCCSNDGNIVTTVSQSGYPYNNTLIISTNNTTYLSSDITLSESILSNLNNNHFFELNTSFQRTFQISMSYTGQYQTIVILNNENMTTSSINSTTGILYSLNFGVNWQYAKDVKTQKEDILKKINWSSVVISYSGQYQTAVSTPSYINNYGYIYYSNDFGQTWTQSSGITGAPSKSWVGVSMTKNLTSVEVGSTSENNTTLFYPEGYIQIAISKEGKIYVSKFDNGSNFIKEQVNMGADDTAQLIVAIDDSASTQNTIVN